MRECLRHSQRIACRRTGNSRDDFDRSLRQCVHGSADQASIVCSRIDALAHEFGAEDLVSSRITSHLQIAPAPPGVIPEFLVTTGRVVAQIHRLEELLLLGVRFWAATARITEEGEFARVPLSAKWAFDAHQCKLG